MNGRGRPLRFVAVVAVGWAGARTMMLWPPGASLPEAIEEAFPIRQAIAAEQVSPPVSKIVRVVPVRLPQPASERQPALIVVPSAEAERIGSLVLHSVAMGGEQVVGAPPGAVPQTPPLAAPVILSGPVDRGSRWSASAWAVTRRGAPAGGAMLGGDQAGVRVAYAVGRAQLYARGTAPLSQPGKEVAAGVDWRPTKLPVRIAAEYRAGLDGVPGGPALAAVGGVDGVALPLSFGLEAYGQAGAVWRDRLDGFADGALRVTREVANAGKARVTLGAGMWGAAQREAARLDVGPSLVGILPLGGAAVRIALDWRERVAGDARPGSGPALTLGADF